MNVLWVEDFGGGLKADSATLINMFRGLLPERIFDDEWNPEADLLTAPGELHDFFCAHSSLHRATLLRHLGDFQTLTEPAHMAFDAVALDINLSRGVPAAVSLPTGFEDAPAFHAKAGFYIYNHLLRLGFPAENICFLTGEKESTFGEFANHCRSALIPLPTAFGKDDAGLESFRAWLAQRQQSPYVELRRGVIEACQQIRRQIAERPDTLQFRHYLESGQISVKAIDDYLATLENALPARPPSDADQARLLRLLVRALAHEWESEAKPNLIKKRISDRRLADVLRAYGWVMKITRNWLAHGEALDQPTPAMAGYLLMVNMRAMFALPAEVQRHERQLLELFGAPTPTLAEKSMRGEMERSFAALMQKCVDSNVDLLPVNNFHDLSNKLENSGANGVEYPQLLLQILWHQLAQRTPRIIDAPDAYECDCRAGSFQLDKHQHDFLHLLLRHIHSASFRTVKGLLC